MAVATVDVDNTEPLVRTLPKLPIWRRYETRIWLGRILVLAILLVAWTLVSGRVIEANLISNPADVFSQLWAWVKSGYIFEQTWVTFRETLEGFAVGGIAGIVFGVALGLNRSSGDVGEPYLISAYGLPKVALAPLFIVWFGIGGTMKVVLAGLSVFFLVFFNTYKGVRQTDPELVDVLRTMRASRWQIIQKVVLPGAKPWIFTGLRLGLPYGFVGAIVGEIVASNQGLGYVISYNASVFNTAALMAALVALVILTSALNVLISWQERRSLRWQQRDGSSAIGTAGPAGAAGAAS